MAPAAAPPAAPFLLILTAADPETPVRGWCAVESVSTKSRLTTAALGSSSPDWKLVIAATGYTLPWVGVPILLRFRSTKRFAGGIRTARLPWRWPGPASAFAASGRRNTHSKSNFLRQG